MTGRFKEQWQNYFEGKIEMWSYFGFQYHSNLIAKHLLPILDVPKSGKIVQIGTGLGIAVETLCHLYGPVRVVGYDLFNPLGHPNIEFLDTEKAIPSVKHMAYLDIDIGSMSHAKENRKTLLHWALSNMVHGGYILTNKKLASELALPTNKPLMSELKTKGINRFDVIELNIFDIPELWSNVHESRLNTKVLLKIYKTKEKTT